MDVTTTDWFFIIIGAVIVAIWIRRSERQFADNYAMLRAHELAERTEVKPNFSGHQTILPMWVKFWAILIGATGPGLLLLSMVAGIVENDSVFIVFTDSELWPFGLVLLIFAPITVWMGFGLVKRNRMHADYLKNDYKYSFAVTKRGLFFPTDNSEDYFIAWNNFIVLNRVQIRSNPKYPHTEFGFFENGEESQISIYRGAHGGFLTDESLYKAINYIIAFAPITAKVDGTSVKDLRKKYGFPEKNANL